MSAKSTEKVQKGITRRSALKTGAKGLALTSAIGIAPKYLISPARATGLAAGMTGGPTGFDGAERFQYNEGMSEGRAIEAAKKLKAAGKAPEKIVFLLTQGAVGQFRQPFPEGAPTVASVWEAETGIPVEIIPAGETEIIPKVMQDITTGSGTYDIYTGPWNAVGDKVDAKGILNLDEFVEKHKPDWGDPERGTPTAEMEKLLYTYNGSYYTISIDGDFQTWVYRKDLFEDADNKKAFEDKYGWSLGPPRTWQETDQISEFFHAKGVPTCNLISPFWGLAIFYARFAGQANPNYYFFDEDGNPNLDTDIGIKVLEEHVKTKDWSSRDILTWTWAEAYGAMGQAEGLMMSTYTNLRKFNDRHEADGTPATPATGKLGSFLPPGNAFGDELVRRSCLYYNINAEISAQSEHPEVAYLFMQWASSTRTFSWMSGNPGGYFDPFQKANFQEPLVLQTYHDDHCAIIQETIARSAPTINFAGQGAFDNALDEQIQAVMVGEKTAEEAMQKASKEWRKIIKKRGETRMIDAINGSRANWPSVIDKA